MSERLANHSDRPWSFTVVRAHGLQRVRGKESWRPIITVTVCDHQCHEVSLGCDGQNPNLKRCFQFHDTDASSRIDIRAYHRALTKKRNKRSLVASASCTLRELARLQAEQQCKQRTVKLNLSSVSLHKGRVNKPKPATILLIAKLDLPEACKVQLARFQEDVRSDVVCENLEDRESSSSPTLGSDDDAGFIWPEVQSGYWSDSDGVHSEDGRDRSPKQQDGVPIVTFPSPGSEDNFVKGAGRRFWLAASILPTSTETASINSRISFVDSIVDSFSPYCELREARVDSDYEHTLAKLSSEWRFVGGSLVALAGLEASVFGFSAGSDFVVTKFAQRAIAIGSVASGIGLVLDIWLLFVYNNATPAKFRKIAVDVYGKYLFFCISARLPALCIFTSTLALTIFLLSVAWTAWPTAVLVMSLLAGVLVSLQFIVYGVHCIVAFVAGVAQSTRRGISRFVYKRSSGES